MGNAPEARWAEIEPLLDQALELQPADRAAFLEQACSGDRELRAEVERLLRAAHGSERLLDESAATFAAPFLARLAETSPLMPGVRLGSYEIEREIGHGGNAVVYLARDRKHDRPVALKVVHPELALSVRTERFVREIEIAAKLSHPHVLPIHDSGEADGVLYCVMPYVEGESLRERLRREARLPVADAIRLAREVADALDYAHRHGIVHRDIKPENILIHEGHAVVADFGIARALSAASGEPTTLPGIAVGTPVYMSPEQGAGSELDGRSDIYSLGTVLYEMLAGEPPFTGATPQEILAHHSLDPVPPVRRTRPDVPAAVEAALAIALAKRPAERFTRAAEFAAALGGEQPVRVTHAARRRIVALVGVAVVTVAAWGIVRWLHPRAIPSVAVLPFVNMTGDTANEYLSDGLSEEVINTLVQVGGTRVPARTSSFAFKGKGMTVQEVARALSVDYVVEGSLRRVGDQLRVTAQLVKANDDSHLWSNTYDRTLRHAGDLLPIQGELARAIVAALRVKLAPRAFAALANRNSLNPEAYDHYLRGREFWHRSTKEAVLLAIDFFQRAIALDSGYALAYSGLSDAYITSGGNGYLPWGDAYPKAKVAALKAVAFDDSLAEAYVSLARARQIYDWDWEGAEQAFRRAIALNPRNALAHSWYGVLLAWVMSIKGRAEEGIRETRLGVELDPQNALANLVHGGALDFGRRYDEALAYEQKAVELAPGWSVPRIALGHSYLRTGAYGQALTELEEARRLNPAVVSAYANIGYVLARTGRRAEALAILRELRARSATPGFWRAVAVVHAGLGDRGGTLAALDSAVALHDFILVGPDLGDGVWDSVRSDPRFARLIQKAGLRD